MHFLHNNLPFWLNIKIKLYITLNWTFFMDFCCMMLLSFERWKIYCLYRSWCTWTERIQTNTVNQAQHEGKNAKKTVTHFSVLRKQSVVRIIYVLCRMYAVDAKQEERTLMWSPHTHKRKPSPHSRAGTAVRKSVVQLEKNTESTIQVERVGENRMKAEIHIYSDSHIYRHLKHTNIEKLWT